MKRTFFSKLVSFILALTLLTMNMNVMLAVSTDYSFAKSERHVIPTLGDDNNTPPNNIEITSQMRGAEQSASGLFYKVDSTGYYLEWRSGTHRPTQIMVKGGDGFFIYDYTGNDFLWDKQLRSPNNNGGQHPHISNIYIMSTELIPQTAYTLSKSVVLPDIVPMAIPPVFTNDETVYYSFTITNTGQTVLENIQFKDPLIGIVDYVDLNALLEQTVSLDIGQYITFELDGIYGLPLQGLAGTITNTATIRVGDYPPVSSDADIYIEPIISYSLVKYIADLMLEEGELAEFEVGDTVYYSFEITNTGNTSLSNIQFKDELLGIDWTSLDNLVDDEVILLPGEDYTFTLTGDYGLDLLEPSESLINTAVIVVGEEDEVTDTYEIVVIPEAEPTTSFTLDKFIGTTESETPLTFNVGNTITYTFRITNTGDTDINLYGMGFEDEVLGIDWISLYELLDLDDEESIILENGESYQFNLSAYPVTFTSADVGVFSNTANIELIETQFSATDTYNVTVVQPTVNPPTPPTPPTPTPTPPTPTPTPTPIIPASTPELTEFGEDDIPLVAPVQLVVTMEGEGSVQTGVYDLEFGEVYNLGEFIPAAGWELTLIGGENGDEVYVYDGYNLIYMNGDKNVHIVFTPIPVPESESYLDEDDFGEAIIPQGVPVTLPQTGGLPLMIPVLLGSGFVGFGTLLRRKK